MTILVQDIPSASEVKQPCSGISGFIMPRVKDLGGITVRRLLPCVQHPMIGPWIFFDHFGPKRFPKGQGLDIRPHPHINMATVTYLFEGEILHRDSIGQVQSILPGALNLMIAGQGIVHSERTPQDVRLRDHTLHGLQLWLALPDSLEEMPPAFYHYSADELPVFSGNGFNGRVMIGTAFGHTSTVYAPSPTLYVEIRLNKDTTFILPDLAEEMGFYNVSGTVKIKDTLIEENTLVVVMHKKTIEITTLDEPVQLVVIGGSPIGKRYIWWNFVSSRPDRIKQAAEDWNKGKFPNIPDETEFIPLP